MKRRIELGKEGRRNKTGKNFVETVNNYFA